MPAYRGQVGHYLFSVKDNQPSLKQDLADLWEEDLPPQMKQIGSHGDRVEVRRLWASEELVGYSDWPHPAQVCRMERIVHHQGLTRRELAYAVTSLQPKQADPARLLELWRGHWGVENRVFRIRDATVDEDRCQVRTSSSPRIIAGLRHLIIQPLENGEGAQHRCCTPSLRQQPSHSLSLVGAPLK